MSGFFVFFESTFVAKQWNTVKTHFHSILTAASKPLFMQFRQNRIYVNHIVTYLNSRTLFTSLTIQHWATEQVTILSTVPKLSLIDPGAIYRCKHNTHLQWRHLCQHQECCRDLSNNSSALHILKHKQMNMLTRNVINLSFVKAMSQQLFNIICLRGYLLSVC